MLIQSCAIVTVSRPRLLCGGSPQTAATAKRSRTSSRASPIQHRSRPSHLPSTSNEVSTSCSKILRKNFLKNSIVVILRDVCVRFVARLGCDVVGDSICLRIKQDKYVSKGLNKHMTANMCETLAGSHTLETCESGPQ